MTSLQQCPRIILQSALYDPAGAFICLQDALDAGKKRTEILYGDEVYKKVLQFSLNSKKSIDVLGDSTLPCITVGIDACLLAVVC
jgi:hypothetical protein